MPAGWLSRKIPDEAMAVLAVAVTSFYLYKLRKEPEDIVRDRCERARSLGPFSSTINYHVVRSLAIPVAVFFLAGSVFALIQLSRVVWGAAVSFAQHESWLRTLEWIAAYAGVSSIPLFISVVLFNRPNWAVHRAFRGEPGMLHDLVRNRRS